MNNKPKIISFRDCSQELFDGDKDSVNVIINKCKEDINRVLLDDGLIDYKLGDFIVSYIDPRVDDSYKFIVTDYKVRIYVTQKLRQDE